MPSSGCQEVLRVRGFTRHPFPGVGPYASVPTVPGVPLSFNDYLSGHR